MTGQILATSPTVLLLYSPGSERSMCSEFVSISDTGVHKLSDAGTSNGVGWSFSMRAYEWNRISEHNGLQGLTTPGTSTFPVSGEPSVVSTAS